MIEAGKVRGAERKGYLSTDLDHTGAADLSGEIKCRFRPKRFRGLRVKHWCFTKLYNGAWTEQFVKRPKKERCFAHIQCFIQIEINDTGVLRRQSWK
jgi:hypothetical protein